MNDNQILNYKAVAAGSKTYTDLDAAKLCSCFTALSLCLLYPLGPLAVVAAADQRLFGECVCVAGNSSRCGEQTNGDCIAGVQFTCGGVSNCRVVVLCRRMGVTQTSINAPRYCDSALVAHSVRGGIRIGAPLQWALHDDCPCAAGGNDLALQLRGIFGSSVQKELGLSYGPCYNPHGE